MTIHQLDTQRSKLQGRVADGEPAEWLRSVMNMLPLVGGWVLFLGGVESCTSCLFFFLFRLAPFVHLFVSLVSHVSFCFFFVFFSVLFFRSFFGGGSPNARILRRRTRYDPAAECPLSSPLHKVHQKAAANEIGNPAVQAGRARLACLAGDACTVERIDDRPPEVSVGLHKNKTIGGVSKSIKST